MIIQCIESSQTPSGLQLYFDGEIHDHSSLDKFLSPQTDICMWKYNKSFFHRDYDYLYLYTSGLPLGEYAPDKEAYKKLKRSMLAHMRACQTANIEFSDHGLGDIIPQKLLDAWLVCRHRALENLHKKAKLEKKNPKYEILRKAHILTSEIAQHKINFRGHRGFIKYDIFGSLTGRLTTANTSIPILTMKKEEREYLKPNNDLFVELDINAAEARTLLALSGHVQPTEDIHSWNMLQLPPWVSRPETKERFFAWLYNPASTEESFSGVYNKRIYKKYWSSQVLRTPFGRQIEVEERKALNYLLQSTTSDIVIESAYNVMKFLRSKKSYLAFTMHDSIVLDYAREDAHLLQEIKRIFENNRFGSFLSTTSVGKDFYNMRKLEL